jgi:hypothetical protein
MATVTILPAGRRSCEENRLRRAWASIRYSKEHQPANYLRLLIAAFNTPRTVYRSAAERDLATGNAERIERGIYWLEWEMARYKRDQAQLQEAMPLLYPKAA